MKASYGEVTLKIGCWDKYNVKKKETALHIRNSISRDKEMRKYKGTSQL